MLTAKRLRGADDAGSGRPEDNSIDEELPYTPQFEIIHGWTRHDAESAQHHRDEIYRRLSLSDEGESVALSEMLQGLRFFHSACDHVCAAAVPQQLLRTCSARHTSIDSSVNHGTTRRRTDADDNNNNNSTNSNNINVTDVDDENVCKDSPCEVRGRLGDAARIATVQLVADDGGVLVLNHTREFNATASHDEPSHSHMVSVPRSVGRSVIAGDVLLLHSTVIAGKTTPPTTTDAAAAAHSEAYAMRNKMHHTPQNDPASQIALPMQVTFVTYNPGVFAVDEAARDITSWRSTAQASMALVTAWLAELLRQSPGLAQLSFIYLNSTAHGGVSDASRHSGGWARSLQLPRLLHSMPSAHNDKQQARHGSRSQHAANDAAASWDADTVREVHRVILATLRVYVQLFRHVSTCMEVPSLFLTLLTDLIASPLFIEGCTSVLSSVLSSSTQQPGERDAEDNQDALNGSSRFVKPNAPLSAYSLAETVQAAMELCLQHVCVYDETVPRMADEALGGVGDVTKRVQDALAGFSIVLAYLSSAWVSRVHTLVRQHNANSTKRAAYDEDDSTTAATTNNSTKNGGTPDTNGVCGLLQLVAQSGLVSAISRWLHQRARHRRRTLTTHPYSSATSPRFSAQSVQPVSLSPSSLFDYAPRAPVCEANTMDDTSNDAGANGSEEGKLSEVMDCLRESVTHTELRAMREMTTATAQHGPVSGGHGLRCVESAIRSAYAELYGHPFRALLASLVASDATGYAALLHKQCRREDVADVHTTEYGCLHIGAAAVAARECMPAGSPGATLSAMRHEAELGLPLELHVLPMGRRTRIHKARNTPIVARQSASSFTAATPSMITASATNTNHANRSNCVTTPPTDNAAWMVLARLLAQCGQCQPQATDTTTRSAVSHGSLFAYAVIQLAGRAFAFPLLITEAHNTATGTGTRAHPRAQEMRRHSRRRDSSGRCVVTAHVMRNGDLFGELLVASGRMAAEEMDKTPDAWIVYALPNRDNSDEDVAYCTRQSDKGRSSGRSGRIGSESDHEGEDENETLCAHVWQRLTQRSSPHRFLPRYTPALTYVKLLQRLLRVRAALRRCMADTPEMSLGEVGTTARTQNNTVCSRSSRCILDSNDMSLWLAYRMTGVLPRQEDGWRALAPAAMAVLTGGSSSGSVHGTHDNQNGEDERNNNNGDNNNYDAEPHEAASPMNFSSTRMMERLAASATLSPAQTAALHTLTSNEALITQGTMETRASRDVVRGNTNNSDDGAVYGEDDSTAPPSVLRIVEGVVGSGRSRVLTVAGVATGRLHAVVRRVHQASLQSALREGVQRTAQMTALSRILLRSAGVYDGGDDDDDDSTGSNKDDGDADANTSSEDREEEEEEEEEQRARSEAEMSPGEVAETLAWVAVQQMHDYVRLNAGLQYCATPLLMRLGNKSRFASLAASVAESELGSSPYAAAMDSTLRSDETMPMSEVLAVARARVSRAPLTAAMERELRHIEQLIGLCATVTDAHSDANNESEEDVDEADATHDNHSHRVHSNAQSHSSDRSGTSDRADGKVRHGFDEKEPQATFCEPLLPLFLKLHEMRAWQQQQCGGRQATTAPPVSPALPCTPPPSTARSAGSLSHEAMEANHNDSQCTQKNFWSSEENLASVAARQSAFCAQLHRLLCARWCQLRSHWCDVLYGVAAVLLRSRVYPTLLTTNAHSLTQGDDLPLLWVWRPSVLMIDDMHCMSDALFSVLTPCNTLIVSATPTKAPTLLQPSGRSTDYSRTNVHSAVNTSGQGSSNNPTSGGDTGDDARLTVATMLLRDLRTALGCYRDGVGLTRTMLSESMRCHEPAVQAILRLLSASPANLSRHGDRAHTQLLLQQKESAHGGVENGNDDEMHRGGEQEWGNKPMLRGLGSSSAVVMWCHALPLSLSVRADAVATTFVYNFLNRYQESTSFSSSSSSSFSAAMSTVESAPMGGTRWAVYTPQHHAAMTLRRVLRRCGTAAGSHVVPFVRYIPLWDDTPELWLRNDEDRRTHGESTTRDSATNSSSGGRVVARSACLEVDVAVVCLSGLAEAVLPWIAHPRDAGETGSRSASTEQMLLLEQRLQLWLWRIVGHVRRGVLVVAPRRLVAAIPLLRRIEGEVWRQQGAGQHGGGFTYATTTIPTTDGNTNSNKNKNNSSCVSKNDTAEQHMGRVQTESHVNNEICSDDEQDSEEDEDADADADDGAEGANKLSRAEEVSTAAQEQRVYDWLPPHCGTSVLALQCPQHHRCRRTATLTVHADEEAAEHDDAGQSAQDGGNVAITTVRVELRGSRVCRSLCLHPYEGNCASHAHVCLEACHSQPCEGLVVSWKGKRGDIIECAKGGSDAAHESAEAKHMSDSIHATRDEAGTHEGHTSCIRAQDDNSNDNDDHRIDSQAAVEPGESASTLAVHTQCPYPCNRLPRPCGHRCDRSCGQDCMPCDAMVWRELSCGQRCVSGVSGMSGELTWTHFPHWQRCRCGAEAQPCEEYVSWMCTRCGTVLRLLCSLYTTRLGELGLSASAKTNTKGIRAKEKPVEVNADSNVSEEEAREVNTHGLRESDAMYKENGEAAMSSGAVVPERYCAGCVALYNRICDKHQLEAQYRLPLPPKEVHTMEEWDTGSTTDATATSALRDKASMDCLPVHNLPGAALVDLQQAFVLAGRKAQLLRKKEALEIASRRETAAGSEYVRCRARDAAQRAAQAAEECERAAALQALVDAQAHTLRVAIEQQMAVNMELSGIYSVLVSDAKAEAVRQAAWRD